MSLRVRLLGSLVLILAGLGVGIHGYWLPHRMEYEAANLERVDRQVLRVLADALLEPLLSGDLAAVHELLAEQRRANPHWRVLTLWDEAGQRLFPLEEARVTPVPQWRWFTQPVADEARLVGRLQAGVDYRHSLATSRRSLEEALGLLAVILVVGFLVLAALQERWVRRPIVSLTEGVRRFAEHGEQVELSEGAVREIRELLASFEKMRQAIVQRERRLEYHRQRLQAVLDSVQDAIFVVSPDRTIIDANPAAARIFGYELSEIEGKSVLELLPGLVLGLPDSYLADDSHAGAPIQLNGQGGDERTFPVEVSVSTVQGGEETLYSVLVRDITPQLEREQEIRRRLAEIQVTISLVPGVVVRVDRSGSLEWWNDRLAQLSGLASHLLVQRDFVTLIDEADRPKAERAMIEARKQGEAEFQGRILHYGRSRGPMHLFRIRRLDQESGSLVMVGVDIEEQLATQRVLREAKDQAEALARSRFYFLANMSHEIRTPLNGMLGMLELLKEHVHEGEAADFLETAERSGEHLLGLLNDILDLSKLEAGQLQLEETEFRLTERIEDLMELFYPRAQSKGIELSWSLEEGVPEWVRGDPTRIMQILSNLVSNAVKFTEQGHVVLRVAAAPGERVVFEVEDTGIGIPEEMAKRVFEPFRQAAPDTTRRFGGTGLGLSLVRQLVRRMGGEVTLVSQPGRGSRFTVRLPLPRVQHVHAVRGRPLTGMRILVVDDLLANRSLIEHVIRAAGGYVHTAEGATEALERVHFTLADGKGYDVLLVDADMPGMDGPSLLRRLQQVPELASARRVLMIPRKGDARCKGEVTVDACLRKPLRRNELLRALLPVEAVSKEVGRVREVRLEEQFQGRVLLVEDNPVNQKVAVAFLRRLGLEVDCAANGMEGVTAWSEGDYDLVLMDVQMPLMDGYEATREIRRREGEGRRTPIVALTANAMEGDEQRCQQAGMDDYLTKPLKLDRLQKSLARWLPRKSAARPHSAKR